MVPMLSVHVTNNTEKTFSMFSRDPSRSFNLSQHCTRHAQWATNLSMWACFPPPFSIHWYAAFSAMGKLAWAFVSNGRAVCSISTKQAIYSLKPPGKSYVPQAGVWQTWTCTPRLHIPSKLYLMRLGLTEEFLWTLSCPLLSLHFVFVIGVWY